MVYTFGMMLAAIVNGPFVAIWGAEMFRLAERPDGKQVFAKIITFYLVVSLTVSLAISILAKDVLRLIANPSFWDAYKIVPLISLSYVLNGVLYIAGPASS